MVKEINTYITPGMFAAMPPIESWTYAGGPGQGQLRHACGCCLGVPKANACRDIYVKLPAEDIELAEVQMRGKLVKGLYGTMDVAQSWQRNCSDTVPELWFVNGRASPCYM